MIDHFFRMDGHPPRTWSPGIILFEMEKKWVRFSDKTISIISCLASASNWGKIGIIAPIYVGRLQNYDQHLLKSLWKLHPSAKMDPFIVKKIKDYNGLLRESSQQIPKFDCFFTWYIDMFERFLGATNQVCPRKNAPAAEPVDLTIPIVIIQTMFKGWD